MTNLTGIMVCLAALLITWRAPVLSLILLITISPFPTIVALTGFDVRIVWIFLLTIRAFTEWLRDDSRSGYLPPLVAIGWWVLVLLTATVLKFRLGEITADEVAIAESLMMYFVAAGCAALTVVIMACRITDISPIVVALSAGSSIVCSYGLWQAATTYTKGNADRVGSVFGNANYLAGYAAVVATTAITLYPQTSGRLRLTLKALIGCAVMTVAVTLSRTGMISLLIAVWFVWLGGQRRFSWVRATTALLIAVLAGVAIVTLVMRDLRERLTFSADAELSDLAEFAQNQEDLSRLEAAQFAVQLVGQYPYFGAGFGTFAARNYDSQGFYVVTHNTVLELVTSTGIAGTLIAFGMVIGLARQFSLAQFWKFLPVAVCFGINALTTDYLQALEMSVVVAIAFVAVRKNLGPDWESA